MAGVTAKAMAKATAKAAIDCSVARGLMANPVAAFATVAEHV
jgi:hypothetical protein